MFSEINERNESTRDLERVWREYPGDSNAHLRYRTEELRRGGLEGYKRYMALLKSYPNN